MNRIITSLLLLLSGIYAVPGMANDTPHTPHAYVVSPYNSTVVFCDINTENGDFENCQNSGALVVSYPTDVAFNVLDKKTYAYIANAGPATKCVVHDDGSLSTLCLPLLNTPPEQFGIAFYTDKKDVQYAYIATGVDYQPVYKCHVENMYRGLLDACETTTSDFSNAAHYIAFETFKNKTYGYITTEDGVAKCKIGDHGDLDCVHSLVEGGAVDLVFQEVSGETYAYITQPYTLRVSKCPVSKEGDLEIDSCKRTGRDVFVSPRGIAFYHAENGLHAYVTDNGASRTWKCAVDSRTGDLKACASTGGFTAPHGITILE